jgi:hypothetical protein
MGDMMREEYGMSENAFWTFVWVFATIIMITFISVSGYNIYKWNARYALMYDKCITEGGSWIPTGNGYAVCMRK